MCDANSFHYPPKNRGYLLTEMDDSRSTSGFSLQGGAGRTRTPDFWFWRQPVVQGFRVSKPNPFL
jgi:hypothetical protein